MQCLRISMSHFGSSKKIACAVLYSGCGVYDGTEVTEAVSLNIHLSKINANVTYFAPNVDQMHAINHLKGEPHSQTRNVLEESARIVRGNIQDLATLDVSQFDALFIPGGFGAAKNLSTFATEGANMKVNEQVEKVIK